MPIQIINTVFNIAFVGGTAVIINNGVMFPLAGVYKGVLKDYVGAIKNIVNAYIDEVYPEADIDAVIHYSMPSDVSNSKVNSISVVIEGSSISDEFLEKIRKIVQITVMETVFYGDLIDIGANIDQVDKANILDKTEVLKNAIFEINEKFNGKAIRNNISINFYDRDYNKNLIVSEFKGNSNKIFESKDFSGIGVLDGYHKSKNTIWLCPVLNDKISDTIMEFKTENTNIFDILNKSNLDKKVIRYEAHTRPNPKGKKTDLFITSIDVNDPPSERVFALI